MYTGCYLMHLYCDGESCKDAIEFPHNFIGRNYSECVRDAKRAGWVIQRKAKKTFCPKCSKTMKGGI